MTAIDRFDPFERRIIEAIDEIAETRAPAYLDDILRRTERTPQRPRWSSPERLLNVNGFRYAIGGAAAVVAVVAIVALNAHPTVGPSSPPLSPTPSIVASQSPGVAAVASDLQGDWLGGHHNVGALGPNVGTHLRLAAESAIVSASNNQDRGLFASTASSFAENKLRLTGPGAAGTPPCAADSMGEYDVSLSASKETMTITAVSETCAARTDAIAGTWWRANCAAQPCLGSIDPGTYGTEYFLPGMRSPSDWTPVFGALTYTTAASWAEAVDAPTHVALVPASDYPRWTAEGGPSDPVGIQVLEEPSVINRPATCPDASQVDTSKHATASEIATFLRADPDLVVDSGDPVMVDGHSGVVLNVQLNASATVSCLGSTPSEEFLVSPFQDHFSWTALGLSGDERMRLILVDVSPSSLVAIAIEARPGSWEGLLTEALPIVQSFRFR